MSPANRHQKSMSSGESFLFQPIRYVKKWKPLGDSYLMIIDQPTNHFIRDLGNGESFIKSIFPGLQTARPFYGFELGQKQSPVAYNTLPFKLSGDVNGTDPTGNKNKFLIFRIVFIRSKPSPHKA